MPDSLDQISEEVIGCERCPRLRTWCSEISAIKRKAYRSQDYWGKPVPGFGDPAARILVVGLAPGAHGSNRTGRMFTGDASGDFLYPALHACGFASQPESSTRTDELTLQDIYITAVCRCAPPQNRPTPQEINNCLPYLEREYRQLPAQGIVALGQIAYAHSIKLIQQICGVRLEAPKFGHGILFTPEGNTPWLMASYHPSRQNTQTGKLSREMFLAIWQKARRLIASTDMQHPGGRLE